MVRSLMYLTTTRSDIAHSVSLISRFVEYPKDKQFLTAKHILRCLQETKNLEIFYKTGENEELLVYTDSDYAGDFDDINNRYGYAFMLGGSVISWASKKQPVVSLSTFEVEFIAVTFMCLPMCLTKKNFRASKLLSEMSYCHLADIMTKPLRVESFQHLQSALGILEEPKINCYKEHTI
ncbi:hypothetical protein CR513_33049, partial [Mucuna pruriens]